MHNFFAVFRHNVTGGLHSYAFMVISYSLSPAQLELATYIWISVGLLSVETLLSPFP